MRATACRFTTGCAINPVTCAAACAELEFTFDGPLDWLHGIVWDYVMPSGEAYTVTLDNHRSRLAAEPRSTSAG